MHYFKNKVSKNNLPDSYRDYKNTMSPTGNQVHIGSFDIVESRCHLGKIIIKRSNLISITYICITFIEIMAQTTMTFRVDNTLKKDFDRLCDEFGLSNTAALTIFMKTMVRERRIPFEIKALSEDK